MPAPDLSTFFGVEDALVSAVSTALADCGAAICAARSPLPLPSPRIEVFVPTSSATAQRAQPALGGPFYVSARTGTIELRLATRRGASLSAVTLTGRVRAALAPGAQRITAANLPYHELLSLEETAYSIEPNQAEEIDFTVLSYAFVIGLPPEHYPHG